jgi:hypothetical protein
MATVIFAHYGRHQAAFTADSGIRAQAAPLAQGVDGLGLGGDDLLFMGRVGRPTRGPKTARSVRRPIAQLRQEPGTVRPPEAASAHR